MRRSLVAALLVLLSGCSWFRHKAVADPAPPVMTMEPVTAARAACPDYDAVERETPFPRDATIGGIAAGTASIVFAVDGTKITILSVTASAPPFGAAAADAVRRLRCTTDHPARFGIGFDWRKAW